MFVRQCTLALAMGLWSCASCTGGGATGDDAGSVDAGSVDAGNQPRANQDSDCDGVTDESEKSGTWGCVLDVSSADSDGDGLSDGIETGVVAPGPDALCTYAALAFDADSSSKTNPCSADTDGDGISDGVEDANRNGRVDDGELNPNNATDGQGPPARACADSQLRPVVFHQSQGSNLQVALGRGFDAASGGQLKSFDVNGQPRGIIGYHPASHVAFVAFSASPTGGSTHPLADEAHLRENLESRGALSNVTTQTFSTWDGYSAAMAFYEQANNDDLIAQMNAIAETVVGPGAGALVGVAGVHGPFQLQAEYVHRSAQQVAVVLALVPLTSFHEPSIFVASDTAGGSALAAFADTTQVRCETFALASSKVDFLFSVDDSASMPDEQQALADIAAAMAQQLNNSTLDWRVAMVTTSYLAAPQAGSNRSVRRGFTRDIRQFQAWLTQGSTCNNSVCSAVSPAPACDSNGPESDGRNGGCWIGAGGTGNVPAEAILGAARKAIDDLSPATTSEHIDALRADAQVVVVLVGDADDQTTDYTSSAVSCVNDGNCESVQHFVDYFAGTGTTLKKDKNPLGKRIVVHGIACPEGQACGETQATPRRHYQVVAGTGGVAGNIYAPASISATMKAILNSAIANGGHRFSKPPIAASIKVATSASVGACTVDDVPRSRVDGFDFDGVSQTLSLFGACRPNVDGGTAAVSYRAWLKQGTDGCMPLDCGGACEAGSVCDAARCVCVPDIN